MSAILYELRASYAFVERNLNLVKRYMGWEIVWFAYSLASALSITYIGAAMERISGADVNTDYLVLYLLIGTLVWRFLSILFNDISEMIQWERWEGTIEYTLMAPIHRLTHMVGQTLFAILHGALFTLGIAVIIILFFDVSLEGANVLGALLVLLAGSFSFIGLGIMASVLPLLFPERGAQMTNVVQALLLLFSGVYYPVEVLPGWMEAIARVSPATYVLVNIRAALLQGEPTRSLLPIIVLLSLAGVILTFVGLWVFRQAELYAKRTGRLKRNG